MHEYRIEYVCADGFESEVIVMAANRTMAFMVFDDFVYNDVISAECYRVMENDEEENK